MALVSVSAFAAVLIDQIEGRLVQKQAQSESQSDVEKTKAKSLRLVVLLVELGKSFLNLLDGAVRARSPKSRMRYS